MDCNVIRDLLPIYCDDMASNSSKKLVCDHLNTCEECRRVYERMKDETCENKEEQEAIDSFRKIKKKNIIRVISAAAAALVLGGIIFIGLYWGYMPTSADNVDISYKISEGEELDDKGESHHIYRADFTLKLKDGKCISVRDVRDQTMEAKVFSTYRIPFDDRGKYPGQADFGYAKDMPFDNEDEIVFAFKDQRIVYNLKELSKEAGL